MIPGTTEHRRESREPKESKRDSHSHEHGHERFLAGEGLTLGDGTQISPAEILRYFREVAPRRFTSGAPRNRLHQNHQRDFNFITGLKQRYWNMTANDRFNQRVANGRPVVAVQQGAPREIYSAAGCLAVHPNFPVQWRARQLKELSLEERSLSSAAFSDECKRTMPSECCLNVAPFAAAQSSGAPIHYMAPMATSRCSDAVYAMEAAKRQGQEIPGALVDFPAQCNAGPWRVEYVARQFRQLAAKLGELSGKAVDDETLRAEIRSRNELRRLAREAFQTWWSAPKPPSKLSFLTEGETEDLPVLKQLLRENIAELKERIAQGGHAPNLAADPLRLFICGTCATVDAGLVEQGGGAIVGYEDELSGLDVDVNEEGDPYVNLAEAACRHPYELPPLERAAWAAEKIAATRADGALFLYNWGCNYQSGVSRLLTDAIQEKSGVPTMTLDVSCCNRQDGAEQVRTRIEAFLEMLERNRKNSAAPTV